MPLRGFSFSMALRGSLAGSYRVGCSQFHTAWCGAPHPASGDISTSLCLLGVFSVCQVFNSRLSKMNKLPPWPAGQLWKRWKYVSPSSCLWKICLLLGLRPHLFICWILCSSLSQCSSERGRKGWKQPVSVVRNKMFVQWILLIAIYWITSAHFTFN